MGKTQKCIAVILCVCFIMVSVFSLVTIASHAYHECAGEHCEICLTIAHLQNTLKHFCAVISAAVFAMAAVFVLTPFVEEGRLNRTGTLISLKVQLNN